MLHSDRWSVPLPQLMSCYSLQPAKRRVQPMFRVIPIVSVSKSCATQTAMLAHYVYPGGVLSQVSDRDVPHRPSTQNATRVKKGGRNYTFCPILVKNRGRNTTFSSFLLKYRGQNTTFSSFLLKYRGRNSTNFPETWKRGVETEEHI